MEARLAAVTRTGRGKNEARRLRYAGQVPAVVYGGESREGLPVAVDPKALLRILHSESGVNTLIGLTVDGGEASKVLVKEFQLDPVHNGLLHVDFYRPALDREITVTIPVTLSGEPLGVKQQGGLLDFVQRDVQVQCMPTEIPEHLEIDVSELMIGDGVRLRDLLTDVEWTPVSEPGTLLVHVIAPKVEEEEEEETPGGGGRGCRRRCAGRGRARGDQEGQGRGVQGKVGGKQCEADRRARESWVEVPGDATQRRLRGGGRVGAASGSRIRSQPCRGAHGARAWTQCAGHVGQAAHVHEPKRPRRWDVDAVFSDRARGSADS